MRKNCSVRAEGRVFGAAAGAAAGPFPHAARRPPPAVFPSLFILGGEAAFCQDRQDFSYIIMGAPPPGPVAQPWASALCEGAAPPREQVVRLGSCSPKWGPPAPTAPMYGRSAPPTPGIFAGLVVPAPTCRRSALHPGDFLPDEKVTKESPRGESPSGYSPWGALSSPQRRQAPLPPEKGGTPGSTQATQPPAEPRISSRKCDPR